MANVECGSITGAWGGTPSVVQKSGANPLNLKNLSAFNAESKQQIRLFLLILQTGESSSKRDRLSSTLPFVRTHRIFINLRHNFWQKWRGHVQRSPPLGDATD